MELKISDSVYNFAKLNEIFELNPGIKGAIIFNSTCYILGNYLKTRGMQAVKLVGYDLIERNTQLLSEGVITALIAQRPERQGSVSYTHLDVYKRQSDWSDAMEQQALRTELNLSVSGGGKANQYFFSAGYLNDKGIALESGYQRFNIRSNVTSEMTSWLKGGVNLSFAHSMQNYPVSSDSKAVSYTHLDVYKRQLSAILASQAACSGDISMPASTWSLIS